MNGDPARIKRINVAGKCIDKNTRCLHFSSEKDIIAIKFKCCNSFYPCYKCHLECANHSIIRWTRHDLCEKDKKVILCGACQNALTFYQYSKGDFECLFCKGKFNPGCALHYNLYFDLD